MDVQSGPTRRVDDAGEKIGGARKDFHLRAMTVADVDGMTAAETTTLVTKDNAWPTPDYAALVDAGTEPRAAALAKVVRDKLSVAPVLRHRNADPREAAKAYVEMLGFLREHMANARTVEEVGQARAKAVAHFGYADAPRDDRYRQLFFGIHSSRHLAIEVMSSDIEKAKGLVKQGFPAPIAPWRRNATVQPMQDGTFVALRNHRVIARGLPTEDAAWQALERSYEDAKQDRKASAKMPLPPHLEKLERTNARRRDGSVTPEAFIEEFGFRGVEFGLWLPDKERQQVLDMAFDAMDDLSLILGIDPKAVALHGNLAIAFGARGHGNAAAHYETGRKVINATRISGAGKVLHEWFHGLDHWFGYTGHDNPLEGAEVRWGTDGREERGGSRVKALPKHEAAVGEAIDAVMHAIKYRPFTDEEHDAAMRAIVEGAKLQIPYWQKQLDAELAIEGRRPPGKDGFRKSESIMAVMQNAREKAEAAEAEIARVAAGGERHIRGSKKSDFYREALKLCGKSGEYWKRPIELFARAGEAWGLDRLNDQFLLSQYLVHSVEPERFASDLYKGNPYPVGAERERINAAFDRLVALLPKLLGERRPDADTRRVGRAPTLAEAGEAVATEAFEVATPTRPTDADDLAAIAPGPAPATRHPTPTAPRKPAGAADMPRYYQASLF